MMNMMTALTMDAVFYISQNATIQEPNDQKLTQQRAVIKQKIVRDVIYIVAVLDHVLGVEGYDEMEDSAKQERNIERDENE